MASLKRYGGQFMIRFRGDKDLRALFETFRSSLHDHVDDIIDYVDHNEGGLAIETLSDWIYELDVEPTKQQVDELLRLSKKWGIDPLYHKFIGLSPPYPIVSPDGRAPAE